MGRGGVTIVVGSRCFEAWGGWYFLSVVHVHLGSVMFVQGVFLLVVC